MKYKLVPVDPTIRMVLRGRAVMREQTGVADFIAARKIYKAMLSASKEVEPEITGATKLFSYGFTENDILMSQAVMSELANADLDILETGVIELIGEDDQGREGCTEVSIQEYAAKAAAILESVTSAPAVEQKPYAYEYGLDNGDGTFSVVINKGSFAQLKENEFGYLPPFDTASKEHPVTPLYLHPQPAPDVAALLDALTPQVLDWVRCGLAANGRLRDGDHPALAKLRAAIASCRGEQNALEDHSKQGGEQ